METVCSSCLAGPSSSSRAPVAAVGGEQLGDLSEGLVDLGQIGRIGRNRRAAEELLEALQELMKRPRRLEFDSEVDIPAVQAGKVLNAHSQVRSQPGF
jgi:hypothetical protein